MTEEPMNAVPAAQLFAGAEPAPAPVAQHDVQSRVDAASESRPEQFTMTVQGGMLEALGINMYTSIGKCLLEFVANAYDSDATFCAISLPFDAIDAARLQIREKAKAEVKEDKRAAFTVLLDPLPEDITIVIRDDGHGMSGAEVQDKFLPLNRHRRGRNGEHRKTEGGARFAMGRKGLGKLAGFGAAERVTVRTKRPGQTYATEIIMDYMKLAQHDDIVKLPIDYEYHEGQPEDEHGTTVTLSGLRCDALKSKEESISENLLDGFFGIRPEDFALRLNSDKPLEPKEAFYEFCYPAELDDDGFATHTVVLEDGETFKLRYVVTFRGRTEDEYDKADVRERGPLVAKRRGARVYCNKRLAAGPTLFDLKTSMHNFHSQSYMECIVEADELDQHNVDLINTNRSDLRRDNDIVDKFVTEVTELMRRALYEHSKYRDAKSEEDLLKSKNASFAMKMLDHVSEKQSKAAKSVLRRLASEYGVDSDNFRQTAPLIINSMNAGRVLIRLMELGAAPDDLPTIAEQLLKLRGIEKNDALKLYKGRRSGVLALQGLMGKGEDDWKKGARFENELHELLKQNPWLIRPEYTGYLTSNQQMATVAMTLSKELAIDEFAGDTPDQNVRPDLVFVLQDSLDVHTIVVVELKSPNVALDQDAEGQLERYVTQIRGIANTELHIEVNVRGFLIGSLPEPTTKNAKELVLLDRYAKQTPESHLQIVTLGDMLRRAWTIYVDAIKTLESEMDEEDDGDAVASLGAPDTVLALPAPAGAS
jgi:hypothetical protein